MTPNETYYTVPLALLRSGQSPLEVFETALSVGIVNAGIGYHKTHGGAVFATLADTARARAASEGLPTPAGADLSLVDAQGAPVPQARAQELLIFALAGWHLLGVSGGSMSWYVSAWLRHQRPGEVFFRIKHAWLWQAVHTARHEAGTQVEHEPRPISWREFRLLAALLSAKTNHFNFSFCGWETLQARACGFHTKAGLKAGRDALPGHCQPLSRQMIRACTDKLEALRFYARCRYSRGKTGGLSAYSFRHPQRAQLIADVLKWDTLNKQFKAKTEGFRADDLAAFRKPVAKVVPKPAPKPSTRPAPEPPLRMREL